MTGSFFGHCLRVATFGESHGRAVGAVVDGLPAGLKVPPGAIQADLDRRRPGRSRFSSAREEPDRIEVLSGLTPDGVTLGSPVALLVENTDCRKADYENIEGLFRPGHADLPMFIKHGHIPQPGGGRASGRETVGRVAAGALARCFLGRFAVSVRSCTLSAGRITAREEDLDFAESNALRCPDPGVLDAMEEAVDRVAADGDSLGGVVGVYIDGLPGGLGSPVFGKLEACLGAAMLSIGGVRGIEFGAGFELSGLTGSIANDPIFPDGTGSVNCGGILGGISTGGRIRIRLAVKPTPSIARRQDTVDAHGRPASICVTGRHDPFLPPRIGPVAEAMAALVAADSILQRMTEVCPPGLVLLSGTLTGRYPGAAQASGCLGRPPEEEA